MRIPRLFFSALLGFTVSIGTAQTATAQSADVKEMVERRMKTLIEQLNLTDAQKEKLRPILAHDAEQLTKLRADTSLSTDARAAKIRDLSDNTTTQMKALLKPDQISKLKDVHEELTPAQSAGVKEMVDKRMTTLTEKLNLTEAQKENLRPIVAHEMDGVTKLRADTSLTPDARRAKIHELGESLTNQMQAVLKPDQMTKLKELRKQEADAMRAKAAAK
jgi:Spy/CpxP family protein refolding chaperone